MSAAGATLLCRWLKQPVVLGYILAGILVGPHTPFFATVTEAESVRTWAEIGVIFLLFGLGLEFSFKKLLKTGFSASVAATIEVLIMMQIGYGLGRLLGWNSMDAVFLGAILSISSTSIVVRALDEAGLKTSHFSRLVYGILIVEDIVAVVLMVVLSTYAAQHTLEGAEVLGVILRIVFQSNLIGYTARHRNGTQTSGADKRIDFLL
jgi:CPA2 family monovalent cation:H+ antiporter-2